MMKKQDASVMTRHPQPAGGKGPFHGSAQGIFRSDRHHSAGRKNNLCMRALDERRMSVQERTRDL